MQLLDTTIDHHLTMRTAGNVILIESGYEKNEKCDEKMKPQRNTLGPPGVGATLKGYRF